jgi:hypothetical protein
MHADAMTDEQQQIFGIIAIFGFFIRKLRIREDFQIPKICYCLLVIASACICNLFRYFQGNSSALISC